MNDEPLRRAFQDAAGDTTPVDEERILAVLLGEASPDEAAAVVELTIDHPAWAAAWQDLKQMLAVSDEPSPTVGAALEPAANNTGYLWIGSGLVALAAAALLLVGLPSALVESPYRDGAATVGTTRSEVLSRRDPVLRWEGVPDGASVQVTLSDVELRPLFEVREPGLTELRVPPAVLDQVGDELLWRVQVTVDGRNLQGPTHRTRVIE